MKTKPLGRPRGTSNTPLNVPLVDELAGYVNQERALATMGITSPAYLRELVMKGEIKAIRIDGRTFLYDKRSVEKFQREREPRQAGEGQSPS